VKVGVDVADGTSRVGVEVRMRGVEVAVIAGREGEGGSVFGPADDAPQADNRNTRNGTQRFFSMVPSHDFIIA
jgi:hypothetical protein